MFKVTKDYRVVEKGSSVNIYSDEVDQKIDKVLEKKELGKLSDKEAHVLIKFYLAKDLKETVNASFKWLAGKPPSKKIFWDY